MCFKGSNRVPSGTYYARLRVKGKFIRMGCKADGDDVRVF